MTTNLYYRFDSLHLTRYSMNAQIGYYKIINAILNGTKH